jgi:hypothetical protein
MKEVDVVKRQAHIEAIKVMDTKITELNQTLAMPCHFSLRL